MNIRRNIAKYCTHCIGSKPLQFVCFCIVALISLAGSSANAQNLLARDSLILRQTPDSIILRSVGMSSMKHNPHTATMYACILPGLGQIYNHKYWKLPILYGGVAALCYAIHFNGENYDLYRRAYRDFITKDPNNKAYIKVIKERTNLTVDQCEGQYASWFQNVLRNKKDYFRRYRDLSYFGMMGLYALQIVDACVDAHFHDFDVSEDLSIHWAPVFEPMFLEDYGYLGARVTISF